jgi:hypothetical protein
MCGKQSGWGCALAVCEGYRCLLLTRFKNKKNKKKKNPRRLFSRVFTFLDCPVCVVSLTPLFFASWILNLGFVFFFLNPNFRIMVGGVFVFTGRLMMGISPNPLFFQALVSRSFFFFFFFFVFFSFCSHSLAEF